MKSASTLLLASSVAAYEYGSYEAKTSSSSSKVGYTTVYPGHGYDPVTVTKQYQAIPTYVADDDSYSGTWSDYVYVSTVIKDYDGKKVTVTETEQPVTVYHTKSTATKYVTEYGYPQPSGYAYPSGYAPKNETVTKPYYELYEKVEEAKYKELGPKALPGYPGSGLWHDEDYQPVEVHEYKGGKWVTYLYTHTYAAPTPSATTYDKPGTYTVPAYDITVTKTITAGSEATYTAPAHKHVTYGGAYTDVDAATTVTAHYAGYETHGAETKTVVYTTTFYCPYAGRYEVAKPTITSYEKDTTVVYPTVTVYLPGVYHHDEEDVTITKSGQAYTCSASKTKTYDPSYPTATTTKHESYPTASKDDYETYPSETPSYTGPHGPDPSSDYEEPAENYGHANAGYVKRGGVLERRKADAKAVAAPKGKRVILV